MTMVVIDPAPMDEHERASLVFVGRQGAKIALNPFDAVQNGDTFNRIIYATPGAGMSVFSFSDPWKKAWLARLTAAGHKCQVPRGFFKRRKPVFVGAK